MGNDILGADIKHAGQCGEEGENHHRRHHRAGAGAHDCRGKGTLDRAGEGLAFLFFAGEGLDGLDRIEGFTGRALESAMRSWLVRLSVRTQRPNRIRGIMIASTAPESKRSASGW